MKTQKETSSKKEQVSSKVPVSSGTGRRKSSVARVWLRRGKGNLIINGIPFDKYFDTEISRLEAATPFRVTQEALRYDADVNVNGGGKEAQADAVKLGVSRALVALYENLRPVLREHGLLSVDSRVKERKKYGQKGARRKFQFVKR
jgi:small subunit ribosomal protein S9